MPDTTPAAPHSSLDLARETLRRLAARRIPPTPANYRVLYEEIAGAAQPAGEPHPASLLAGLARDIAYRHPALDALAKALAEAVEHRQWRACQKPLSELVRRLHPDGAPADGENLALLRDLLAHTLELATANLLDHAPALAERAQRLAGAVRNAASSAELRDVAEGLRRLWLDLEMNRVACDEEQELLRRLLVLLVENVADLVPDERWLAGQLAVLQEVISGPPQLATLREAERRLKDLIYKQQHAHHALAEATATLKTSMGRLVAGLGEAVAANAAYQGRIGDYAARIEAARDVPELTRIFDTLLADTRAAQADTLRAHDRLLADQAGVHTAEARIRELESQLAEMSTKLREDPLTGSLNRRGLDEELAREIARAERFGWGFSVALLDLDDFKALNDARGHRVGDAALTHLAGVARRALRPFDLVARLGGEEFLLVLPRTDSEAAAAIVRRLQRTLTREFFLDRDQPVLVTFSAGVAQWQPGLTADALISDADAAMYSAKRAGKNRVEIAAQQSTSTN